MLYRISIANVYGNLKSYYVTRQVGNMKPEEHY